MNNNLNFKRLCSAIEKNSMEQFMKYLYTDYDLNGRDEEGYTLMTLVCRRKMAEMIKLLANNGTSFNASASKCYDYSSFSSDRRSDFSIALHSYGSLTAGEIKENEAAAEAILDSGYKFGERDCGVIGELLRINRFDLVKRCFEQGYTLGESAYNYYLKRYLESVVNNNNFEELEYFYNNGMDLQSACEKLSLDDTASVDMVKYLLEKDVKIKEYGKANKEVFNYLLEAKVQPSEWDMRDACKKP